MTDPIRCHYDILGVERDADATTIKKAHRQLALRCHPDKPNGDAAQFRLVQQAYECLSDPVERKWYDEHRTAILRGWSGNDTTSGVTVLFDVMPYMYGGCYNGYGTDQGGFYAVYQSVFDHILHDEAEQGGSVDSQMPRNFGAPDTPWSDVLFFYQSWESFASTLSFAWADLYDTLEAPNRRVRRAMDDENRKARKTARKERHEQVSALVRFVKRRDPRIQAWQKQQEQEKRQREQERLAQAELQRREAKLAKEQWKQQAEEALAQADEEDRLAGRLRLADLDDDYDYGGTKRGKKKKKGVRESSSEEEDEEAVDGPVEEAIEDHVDLQSADGAAESNAEESEEEEESSEEEPDFWRCECCRKDFKSEAQMQNHMKSKKHKETYKKYQKKFEKELMEEMLDSDD